MQGHALAGIFAAPLQRTLKETPLKDSQGMAVRHAWTLEPKHKTAMVPLQAYRKKEPYNRPV